MTRIVWFRRDLRLTDNPALIAACSNDHHILCVYVHAPDEEAPWQPGAASRWWLHHSLSALDRDLRQRGQRLLVIHGPSEPALQRLASEVGSTDIHVCALVEPAVRQRDRTLQKNLAGCGVSLHRHAPNLLFEPDSLRTAKGDAYRVFTPFWRQARAQLAAPVASCVPELPPLPEFMPAGVALDLLALLPRVRWDRGLGDNWQPGEEGALIALTEFLTEDVTGYPQARNRPDQPGTSRLSPHLHFGEITPQQIVREMADRGLLEAGEGFVRELGWREFCHHLLWHFPHTTDAPMDARFADYPWQEPPDVAFRIFNPVLQGQRFDPRGDYVRRWIPELARVPTPSIHAPWKLTAGEHREYGIADTVYASPLIDLAMTRAAALAGLSSMRSTRRSS